MNPTYNIGQLPGPGWYFLKWKDMVEGPYWCTPFDDPIFGYGITWGHDRSDDPEMVASLFDDPRMNYECLEWQKAI